ncbi:MAG: Unknown protein [uncultured Sulfurovum sp.]|uniref:Lycopene cyclase domain-containing protein n=1 Tax=uncultured Sulfurovum sp. TaxID=269237 RepID=A0A6S6S0T5_9BACT|nr:MAG: Unknown protein [uncultured Sulfurovum sp.]
MDNFGYISISLLMFPIWFYIYIKAKWLRLRMRNIGIYVGILAAIFEPLFIADYWNPPPLFNINHFYVIEDFLFGFFSGGLAISIYNFIFSIQYVKKYKRRKKLSALISVSTVLIFLLLNKILEYNSIFAFSISVTIALLILFTIRKDLILPALSSSILSTTIIMIGYIIIFNIFLPSYWSSYWLLVNTNYEYYILGIPWTEYLYYFIMQSYLSIIYDFASGTGKSKQIPRE